jgi:hypothetical protein
LKDKLKKQDNPTVLGYELNGDLIPIRKQVNTKLIGDHGCDPLGDGMFRMVPSGDIVDGKEMNRRLERS